MLLTHDELLTLVEGGAIRGFKPGSVNGSSVDVHLSDVFLRESPPPLGWGPVELSLRQPLSFSRQTVPDGFTFVMEPGEFVLASTMETFYLDDSTSALFVMKSSMARSALDQMNAAWCAPGWSGSALTLELMNVSRFHRLSLAPGMPIGQMVFFKGSPIPPEMLYANRGAFNHQRVATPSS